MAYLRAGSPVSPPSLAHRTLELRLGTRAEPYGARVKAFPYTSPSGSVHQSFSFLQWLNATQLVYLGENLTYPQSSDTLRTGIEIVTIDATSGALTVVPGTTGATSVALAGSDVMYYTLDTSAVIWRRVLSSGVVSPAQAFPGIVRDVTAGGGRLAAITGFGGLWLIDPGVNGVQLFAPTLTYFLRPVLSPDGGGLVVEGYPFRVDTIRVNGMIVAIDTTLSRSSDLWFFDLQ